MPLGTSLPGRNTTVNEFSTDLSHVDHDALTNNGSDLNELDSITLEPLASTTVHMDPTHYEVRTNPINNAAHSSIIPMATSTVTTALPERSEGGQPEVEYNKNSRSDQCSSCSNAVSRPININHPNNMSPSALPEKTRGTSSSLRSSGTHFTDISLLPSPRDTLRARFVDWNWFRTLCPPGLEDDALETQAAQDRFLDANGKGGNGEEDGDGLELSQWRDPKVPIPVRFIGQFAKPYPFSLDPTRKFLRSLFNMAKDLDVLDDSPDEETLLSRQLRTEVGLAAFFEGLKKKKRNALRPDCTVSLLLADRDERNLILRDKDAYQGETSSIHRGLCSAIIDLKRPSSPPGHFEDQYLVQVLSPSPQLASELESLLFVHHSFRSDRTVGTHCPFEIMERHRVELATAFVEPDSLLRALTLREMDLHNSYREESRCGDGIVTTLFIYASHLGHQKEQTVIWFMYITDAQGRWCITPLMSGVISLQQLFLSIICGGNLWLDFLSMARRTSMAQTLLEPHKVLDHPFPSHRHPSNLDDSNTDPLTGVGTYTPTSLGSSGHQDSRSKHGMFSKNYQNTSVNQMIFPPSVGSFHGGIGSPNSIAHEPSYYANREDATCHSGQPIHHSSNQMMSKSMFNNSHNSNVGDPRGRGQQASQQQRKKEDANSGFDQRRRLNDPQKRRNNDSQRQDHQHPHGRPLITSRDTHGGSSRRGPSPPNHLNFNYSRGHDTPSFDFHPRSLLARVPPGGPMPSDGHHMPSMMPFMNDMRGSMDVRYGPPLPLRSTPSHGAYMPPFSSGPLSVTGGPSNPQSSRQSSISRNLLCFASWDALLEAHIDYDYPVPRLPPTQVQAPNDIYHWMRPQMPRR